MELNASTRNLTATSSPYYSKDAFIISSGASHHLTGNILLFDQESLFQYYDTLKVGNAYTMDIVGFGSITRPSLPLPDVRYVPGLKVNAVSIGQLSAMDYDVLFIKNGGCVVKERLGGEVVGEATLLNGLYMVDYLRIPLDRICLPDYETIEAALGFL